jgi:hypothetical protein
VKFQATLECKGLWAAINEPESAKGKKASVEARGYLILYIQDAFVKLIVWRISTSPYPPRLSLRKDSLGV